MTNELLKLDINANDKNYRELNKRLPQIIEMHINVKQLSESIDYDELSIPFTDC